MNDSFWDSHGAEVTAVIILLVTFAIAYMVDRLVIARGAHYAGQVSETPVSRATRTRLRLVRRLVFASIIALGVTLALGQFTSLTKLAAGILASGAVLGIILGLAARQVLANPLAGILLAITQPIRIGDRVTIHGETGRVNDLSLSYTFIDTGDGRLMVVPNEQVVTTVLFNRSTANRNVPPAASVWLPPGADVARARAALAGAEVGQIELAEITPDGVRLVVHGRDIPDRTLADSEEAALRESAHQALAEAGILRADLPPAEAGT